MNIKAIELLLDSARGSYIPRDFVESMDVPKWGLDPESWQVKACADPDSELYWEAWESIVNNAEANLEGYTYRLHHDGDLWAVDYDRMTEEEKINFGFED